MTVYTGYSVSSLAELTAIGASERADLFLLYVGETNKWYRYNPTASDLADNLNIINPDDSAGRWVAVGAASAEGGGGGGGSTVGVQNGRPTDTPTATGIIIADNRDDRGTLWVSVGTNSPDDWQVFGYRPIRSSFQTPLDNITPDFVGQQFIYTEGGQYGTTKVYVATGLHDMAWQKIYSYTNS